MDSSLPNHGVSTKPGQLQFDGSAPRVTIPSDATWHTVASSGYLPLLPASAGAYGTRGHGFAYLTANEGYAAAGLTELYLTLRDPQLAFEVGTVYAPGSNGTTSLLAGMSDLETLGIATGSYNNIDLKAAGNCSGSPARSFTASRFQVLAIPDNMGIHADNNCSPSANDCCSQHPSCIAYQCAANAALPRNTHASSPVCTIPPAAEPAVSHFYSLAAPCRAYDSRTPPNRPLAFNTAAQVQVGGTCGIPGGARAVALNLTAIAPTSDVSIQAYPGNQPPPPGTNVLSAAAGTDHAAFAVLPLATNGTGTVFLLATATGSGSTDFALDVSGYFQ